MKFSPAYLKNLLFLLILSFAAVRCNVESDVTIIKLAHGLDPTHPVHIGMHYMAERLQELSEGSMRIDIYPSEQLGTERQCLELLQIGSLAMTKVSSAVLEGFAPAYRVFGLPYLYRDDDHRFSVLEGSVGEDLLIGLEPFRIRGLCFYDAGYRSFYTVNRPIRTPDDLSGLKIRVQESPMAIQMVNIMGGAATPVSWGELYTALQQGVVDGAENNPPSFYTSYHFEVARYFSINRHTAVPDVLVISKHVWDHLTPQEQNWLQQAANESSQYQKIIWKESTEESLRAVEEAGVEIIYPDREPFFERVQPLYDRYRADPLIGPLLEKILATEHEHITSDS
jgi:tripartite ATP-independent transporter DctP family solute receptor